MMYKILVCCFVITAPAVLSISVLGPRILRPFGSYRVAIAGSSRAHNLYVAVEGRKANGEQFTQGREVQVQAAASRIVELDIGEPGPGQYSLVARSTSGPQFSSSAPLSYQPRSFCVFVQTDKRVYQPADTIHFRVIALDKYLLPLPGAVDVTILDAGGSPMSQWVGVTLDRGLVTDELVLADELALGEWTIQVEVRGQTYSKKILVADYVMPKFQMEMSMPKEILFKDGRFNINVTAKHFNGLPVRGELTISSYAVFFSGLLQPVVASPARKVIDFNGQADVVFDLKTDLDLAEDAARPLVVEAVLEEKDTLIKQNVSSRILLLRTPYRLKVTAPSYFKPTLPFNVQIEVVDSSGHVIVEDGDVSVERLWDDGAPANVTTLALKEGKATYTLVPDRAHVNSTLNLVIKYKEVSERVVNVQRSEYSYGQYLTVELLTKKVAVGDEMRARVTATEPMDIVHYIVISRGDILLAKTIELSPSRVSVDISIPVSGAMSAGCSLVAWYPQLSPARTHVLASALYVPVKDLLLNKVTISPVGGTGASPKPNSLIELKVSGEPGSIVAVLGEDANAIAAGLAGGDGRGDGLDINTIQREVESFSGLKHSMFKNEDHFPEMGVDLGGYTSADVFMNAGVVILTDGVVVKSSEESAKDDTETGTRPPLAGPYAFSRLPPPPSPRYYLTVNSMNTWMLANFTIDNEGKGTKERWTPMTPTELSVGAFSIHPTLGLGVAEPEKFTILVPLSMTADLPATLQKGESLAVVITLKNSLAVATLVEVTFYNSDQYFEFEPLENNLDSTKKIELFRREKVSIPARGSASTAFLVTAVRGGDAPIIVEATGNGVSDSLFRTIEVQEGYSEELWSWQLLDARRSVGRANVTLFTPPGVKPQGIMLAAAGDLLAPAAAVLRKNPTPAAAPPQAVKPLALACVLLDYLQATGQKEAAIESRAREQAALGYQRLMAYRRPDGSFTADTGDDAKGDVWMTSVSARWLSRCARHVRVGPGAGAAAARWLGAAQRAPGDWPPPAAPDDPRAQAPLPLAANALLALLQAQGSDILYRDNIIRAQEFLAQSLSPELDAYTLATVGAALAAAKNSQSILALQMMDRYANTTGNTVYWSRRVPASEWRSPWLAGNSVETATAAAGLRALLAARRPDDAAPVARYLLQAHAQDVDPDVVDAIAQFAEVIKSSTKLRVSVNLTDSDDTRQFQIGDNNALIIQTLSVRNVKSASAVTEGRGVSLVGLAARGASSASLPWPRYTLDPRVDHVSTKDRLQLSICYGFVPQGNETESGTALLTIQLPSGFIADINTITELTAVRHVWRARLAAGGARVVARVAAARAERCVTLAAPRARPVARQRPAWVTLQDLYDSSHRARQFYQAVSSSSCDVCREWSSCARACGAAAQQRAPDDSDARKTADPNAGVATLGSVAILLLALAVTVANN